MMNETDLLLGETFFYLTTTGWQSGKLHKIEIWYVAHCERYYLVSENRLNAHWVQNIQRNPLVSFHIAQRKCITPTEPIPGVGRVLSAEEDAELISIITQLFDEKYGWNVGIIVEITPAIP
ncbi:MAG: nitroreductase/quinone reductase family protein [Phototrophicaceae bacterium]